MDAKTSAGHQSWLQYAEPQTEIEVAVSSAVMPMTLRLSIVSNSKLLWEGLPKLLSPYFSLELIGTYPGEPLTSPMSIPVGHLVLLDSRVGIDIALEWTRRWRGQHPPSQVVIMELTDETTCIVDCIAAGACAYVLQGASISELAETILQVRQGLARCSPEVAAQLFARLEAAEHIAARHLQIDASIPLTRREKEVVDLITRGYSNKQIADELVIALHTVKHHVHNILDKLQLHQRSEVAHVAANKGWIKD